MKTMVRGSRLALAASLLLAACAARAARAADAAPADAPAAPVVAATRDPEAALPFEASAGVRSGFELAAHEAVSGPLMAADTPLSAAAFDPPRFEFGRRDRSEKGEKAPKVRKPRVMPTLSPDRARILLRSLTVPGWGQATLGHNRSAMVFLVAEAGVWGSFAAFRIQERMRKESTIATARDLAGIDLRGRDEEFFRIVGSFLSSEEYNQLVVARDAANQFYDRPAEYFAYIEKNSLKGADGWAWPDVESLIRFRAQRKDAQRAGLRANSALAVAIANRLLSAVHAARLAGRPDGKHSWNLEVAPAGGDDPTAFRLGVRTQF